MSLQTISMTETIACETAVWCVTLLNKSTVVCIWILISSWKTSFGLTTDSHWAGLKLKQKPLHHCLPQKWCTQRDRNKSFVTMCCIFHILITALKLTKCDCGTCTNVETIWTSGGRMGGMRVLRRGGGEILPSLITTQMVQGPFSFDWCQGSCGVT